MLVGCSHRCPKILQGALLASTTARWIEVRLYFNDSGMEAASLMVAKRCFIAVPADYWTE
jgi:hypothetical protein